MYIHCQRTPVLNNNQILQPLASPRDHIGVQSRAERTDSKATQSTIFRSDSSFSNNKRSISVRSIQREMLMNRENFGSRFHIAVNKQNVTSSIPRAVSRKEMALGSIVLSREEFNSMQQRLDAQQRHIDELSTR